MLSGTREAGQYGTYQEHRLFQKSLFDQAERMARKMHILTGRLFHGPRDFIRHNQNKDLLGCINED